MEPSTGFPADRKPALQAPAAAPYPQQADAGSPGARAHALQAVDFPGSRPAQALDLLRQGNDRFVRGAPRHPNQDAWHRASLASVQHPVAVLFGCSDSRLAAEIIFDLGLGDLFVVRTAGHVVGAEVLGSVEYGLSVLDCRLVVVLGHDACGAVAAAQEAVEGGAPARGYVRDVVERVTPSVLAARAAGLTRPDDVIDEHVRRTVDLLLDRSRILADQVSTGHSAIVGLSYRLADGSARLVADRAP